MTLPQEIVSKIAESIAYDALTSRETLDESGLICRLVDCHMLRHNFAPLRREDFTDSHVEELRQEVAKLRSYVDEQRQTLESFQNKL